MQPAVEEPGGAEDEEASQGAADAGGAATTGQVAPSGFGPLVPVRGPLPDPAVSLAGVFATDFYLECMATGGSLPTLAKADKRRGQLVIDYFSAFATPAERALLLPPPPVREGQTPSARDEGQRRLLGLKLHDLLVEKLRYAFISASLEVPTGIKKDKKVKMLVGALETRLEELAKKSKVAAFKADPVVFALFRAESEKGKGAPKDGAQMPKRPRADSTSSALGGAAQPVQPLPPLQLNSRAAGLMQTNRSD